MVFCCLFNDWFSTNESKKSNSIILIHHKQGIYEFEPETNHLKHLTKFPNSAKEWLSDSSSLPTSVCKMENMLLFCGGSTSYTSSSAVSDMLIFCLNSKKTNQDEWIHFQNIKLPQPIASGTSIYIPSLQIVVIVCDRSDNKCFDFKINNFMSKWDQKTNFSTKNIILRKIRL